MVLLVGVVWCIPCLDLDCGLVWVTVGVDFLGFCVRSIWVLCFGCCGDNIDWVYFCNKVLVSVLFYVIIWF